MDTLVPELAFSLLLEAEDDDLPSLCRTNTYYSDLCKDEKFWKDRLLRRYGLFSYLKKYFDYWKDFYDAISNRAIYRIDTSSYSISTTIEGVWKIILDYLQVKHYIETETFPSIFDGLSLLERFSEAPWFELEKIRVSIVLDFDKRNPIEEVLLLKEKNKTGLYIHPDFPYLPSLSPKYPIVAFSDPTIPIEEFPPFSSFPELSIRFLSQSLLLYLYDIATSGQFNLPIFYMLSRNKLSSFAYTPPYYPVNNMFVRYNLPLFFRRRNNRIEYTTIPEEFYDEFIEYDDLDHVHINVGEFWRVLSEIKDDLLWHKFTLYSFTKELENKGEGRAILH